MKQVEVSEDLRRPDQRIQGRCFCDIPFSAGEARAIRAEYPQLGQPISDN
jgi:hypothetical protein